MEWSSYRNEKRITDIYDPPECDIRPEGGYKVHAETGRESE